MKQMKRAIVNIVERSVADITSPFARKRTDPLFNIAPSENRTVTLCTMCAFPLYIYFYLPGLPAAAYKI